MNRAAPTWLAFSAALLLALAVMLFGTIRLLHYERAEARQQANAALEETVRLALWRMDSAAAVLLASPPGVTSDGKPANNDLALNSAPPLRQAQQRFDTEYQTQISRQEYTQRGTLNANRLDAAPWRTLAPALLDRISDILPGASLESADGPPDADTRRLASIPARLVIPAAAAPSESVPTITPLRIALAAAWACMLLAAGAVAYLLSATLSLSERRAGFAAAVTHEMRTPLTTFRMYAEMLHSGMVHDPERRAQYLSTLVSESDRLGHLIENVLAYSRLENKLSPRQAQPITVAALLEQSLPILRRRVAQAGVALNLALSDHAAHATLHTDPFAVQQVLINLVDNACKFARTDIHLSAVIDAPSRRLLLTIGDRGPGLPPSTRLFSAFSKSRSDPIPGIGLGLYLSRQLARDIGGDLSHAPANPGTSFTLSLPL